MQIESLLYNYSYYYLLCMQILNIVPNMNHHYQAYGGWSFALDDYLEMGLMAYLNSPLFLDLAAVVDPWTYKDRLTMPKLIMTACGDEFFLPGKINFAIGDHILTCMQTHRNSS
jgi:PhoPQ-activated pathogenicity-related protein